MMQRVSFSAMMLQVDVADAITGHYNPRNDVILRLEYINAKHTKACTLMHHSCMVLLGQ